MTTFDHMASLSRPAGDGLTEFAAGEGALPVALFILIAAALLVLLIGVVWRVGARRNRSRPPRPDEQPRRPDHPTHVDTVREPDEFPQDGERLTPHQMKGYGNVGSRPAPPDRPRRSDDSGGSFGSGGLGG